MGGMGYLDVSVQWRDRTANVINEDECDIG